MCQIITPTSTQYDLIGTNTKLVLPTMTGTAMRIEQHLACVVAIILGYCLATTATLSNMVCASCRCYHLQHMSCHACEDDCCNHDWYHDIDSACGNHTSHSCISVIGLAAQMRLHWHKDAPTMMRRLVHRCADWRYICTQIRPLCCADWCIDVPTGAYLRSDVQRWRR